MEVEPGSESFAESFQQLVEALREESDELEHIEQLSADSLREWLDNLVQQISASFGMTLARARAMVDDYLAIAANARTSFRDNYKATRAASRRVKRRS